MPKGRPYFNRAVRALLDHIVATMPEFSHIKPSRILIVAGEARRASRGTVKPLLFEPGQLAQGDRRRKPVVRIRGRKMLYCITLRPLFFRASTPKERVGTIVHELFHISPSFDGTLSRARRHSEAGRDFQRRLRPLVRRYLKLCPAELMAQFAFDGEVRVQMWLERPNTFYVKGMKVRRVYTEDQLFVGPVRMITRRPKASVKAGAIKLH